MGGHGRVRGVLAVVAAGFALLSMGDLAHAQRKIGTGELKTVIGQVELQRKGESQWVPAVVGAKLAEGDNIRAHVGGSAVLDLPDGSTLMVAENSRVVVGKLEFDPQNQTRVAFFHLVVGKVRAAVSQAAITLVQARQSNFAISTPTAVAAARGTVFEVVFNVVENVMRVAVLVKDPLKPTGLVSCLSLYNRFASTLVREGLSAYAKGTEGCSPPVPISSLPDANLVGTPSNPRPPGPAFSGPVTVPSVGDLPGLAANPAPVVFTSDPAETGSPLPPSTIGVNIGQTPPPQQPSSSPVSP